MVFIAGGIDRPRVARKPYSWHIAGARNYAGPVLHHRHLGPHKLKIRDIHRVDWLLPDATFI
jgi:hypothetical protein